MGPIKTGSIPKMFGKEVDEDCVKFTLTLVDGTLKALEGLLSKGGDYFAGSEISIADLQFFFEVGDVFHYHMTLDAYPKLKEWYERIA